MDDLRCLSLMQPYADAIAAGVKPWENRPRRLCRDDRWPMWVGLHASGGWMDGLPPSLWPGVPSKKTARRGVVLGAVLFDLVADYPSDEQGDTSDLDAELRSNPWAFGPVCMRVADYRPLPEPMSAKGMLGLWRPTEERAPGVLAALQSLLATPRVTEVTSDPDLELLATVRAAIRVVI